ncbi:hypothetical protein A3768_4442 (plasmid) [Ralstonia solanacearum]|nr:hypothetical protein A3768_4442 [Ralstonia solanacearum]
MQGAPSERSSPFAKRQCRAAAVGTDAFKPLLRAATHMPCLFWKSKSTILKCISFKTDLLSMI